MKHVFFLLALLAVPGTAATPARTVAAGPLSPQDKETAVVAPASKAAEGLDLHAAADVFKDSKDLEEFERKLNDPDNGINNLDLDENGEVDFIRVMEEAEGDTRVIVMQAALGKDEFQDVATIEVEKADADYRMQVRGNEVVYGPRYYIAPVAVRVVTWPIIGYVYRPVWRPYRSVYHYGAYPRWWRPFHPVAHGVYRARAVKYRTATFKVGKTGTVKSVTKVKYNPRTSRYVKTKTTVTKTKQGTKVSRTKTRGRKN